MPEKFANSAADTLAAAITSTGATTLTVNSAAPFPASGNFRIIIDNELLLVTGVSGTTFTVQRGIEGTTAATHSSAAAVTHIVTVGSLLQTGRDNDPYHGARQFGLLDASGNPLTSADFDPFGDSPAVTDQNGTIALTIPTQLTASNSVRGLTRSLTAPYVVTAAVRVLLLTDSGAEPSAGVFWTDGTQLLAPAVAFIATDYPESVTKLGIQEWNTAISFNTWLSGPVPISFGDVAWFRLTDDNTNLTVEISNDGLNWIQIYQDSRTAYLTPSAVGFFANGFDNSTYPVLASLVSWSEA